MISLKEEFIPRYIQILNHKVIQELKEKLPDTDFLVNMQERADEIVREIVKDVR